MLKSAHNETHCEVAICFKKIAKCKRNQNRLCGASLAGHTSIFERNIV